MNIIIGMIYFLKSTKLDHVQLEYIQKLEESSSMLLDIVNNILALSNNNKYNVTYQETNFNLKDLFKSINEIFEDKIKSKDGDRGKLKKDEREIRGRKFLMVGVKERKE